MQAEIFYGLANKNTMIEVLENIIKGLALKLNDLGFISKSGGLLQETTIVGTGATVVQTSAQIAPFADGKLVRVSPDKSETVITFFTAGATRVIRQDLYLMQLENEITLTGWINGNRTGRSELASPEMQIMNAIKTARLDLTTGGPVRDLEIVYSGDNEGSPVSRWGWDKPEFQYGVTPHRIFQQKYRVVYTIAQGCATQTVNILNPAC